MLPHIDEKGIRLPTACEPNDMIADAGGREKSGTADAKGVPMNPLRAGGTLERGPNRCYERVPHEGNAGTEIEDGICCRPCRTEPQHVRDGGERAIESPGETKIDGASDTRLGTRKMKLKKRTLVSRIPALRQISTLGLPGRVEGVAILGREFTDPHKTVERRATGGPDGGPVDGKDVQRRSDEGEMPTLDRKPKKSRARRPRKLLHLLEDEIEEREGGTLHGRPAKTRDLKGDYFVEVSLDRIVRLVLGSEPVCPVGQQTVG